MSEAEERVRQIFDLEEWEALPEVSEESLETYWAYLVEHLEFPFQAAYEAEEEPEGVPIQVTALLPVEQSPDDPEMFGLFCEAVQGRQTIQVPLSVVEVTDPTSENYQLVEDYKEWFWSYR